jgi:excisionase family DNA binding protein
MAEIQALKSDEVVPRLLLNVREAAKALAISERSLWTLTNTGVLSSVRIGRAVRYAIADLESYIDRRRTGSDDKTSKTEG